jgi:uncharacterized membrane protein
MQRLRDMLIDGLLLAVPLIVLGYILFRTVEVIARLSSPIAKRLPDFKWWGVAMADIVAVIILVLLLLGLGAFAISPIGRKANAWLERVVLSKIPGFLIFKSMAAGFSNDGRDAGLVPALVTFDDNTVLGFVVESGVTDEELLTVFVPSAPTPAAGTVFLMPRERVRILDVSVARAMGTVTRLGLGLKELLPADAGARTTDKSA